METVRMSPNPPWAGDVTLRPTAASRAVARSSQLAHRRLVKNMAYPKHHWDIIEKVVFVLRHGFRYRMEEVAMVLSAIFHFHVSANAIQQRIGEWRSKPGKDDIWGVERVSQGTRSKKSTKNEAVPDYVWLQVVNMDQLKSIVGHYDWREEFFHVNYVDRPLRLRIYQEQFKLLVSIDKYIKGFFDAFHTTKNRKPQFNHREAEAFSSITTCSWQLLSVRCHNVMPKIRAEIAETLSRSGKRKRLRPAQAKMAREKAKEVLEEHLFTLKDAVVTRETELDQPPRSLNPHMLPHFWELCFGVRGIALQLPGRGQPRNNRGTKRPKKTKQDTTEQIDHVPEAMKSLMMTVSAELDADRIESHWSELWQIIAVMPTIATEHLENTLRLACACTARALTSRLGAEHPTVLRAWAVYHRHCDPYCLHQHQFLPLYEKALEHDEAIHGPYHPRTLNTLGSYLTVAHYTFSNEALSRRLANDLWARAWAIVAPQGALVTVASPAVMALADSAKILLALAIVDTKQQVLRGPFRRPRLERRQRAVFPHLTNSPSFNEAADRVQTAIDKLRGGDGICGMAADGLFNYLISKKRQVIADFNYRISKKREVIADDVSDEEASQAFSMYINPDMVSDSVII